MYTKSDPLYFQKQADRRMMQMRRIRSDIEVKNNVVKGRARDITSIVQKKKLTPSIEQKFKDHCETFKKIQRGNIHQFQQLLREASDVCEELIPNIQRIKSEDKKIHFKWLRLKKNYETNLDVNTETWQTDDHYRQVKEYLIQMQQDKRLPSYYKFCLINSRDTMSRMNRSNQEVKDTRLLYALSNKIDEKKVKMYLERMLKKYQRIHENQELVRRGSGWKLVSKKELIPRDEDQQVINAHLKDKRELTFKEEFRLKTEQFARNLKLDSERKNYYKMDENPMINKFQRRIYKTENSRLESNFSELIKEAYDSLEKNEKNFQDFQQNYKQALFVLRTQHQQNYKGTTLQEGI